MYICSVQQTNRLSVLTDHEALCSGRPLSEIERLREEIYYFAEIRFWFLQFRAERLQEYAVRSQ